MWLLRKLLSRKRGIGDLNPRSPSDRKRFVVQISLSILFALGIDDVYSKEIALDSRLIARTAVF